MPTPHAGHNRLWFWKPNGDSNNRLEYLKTQYPNGQKALGWPTPSNHERWQYAFKYLLTGSSALQAALDACDDLIADCSAADTGSGSGIQFIFNILDQT